MKLNIVFEFRDTPFGGANQFLKAIRNYFRSINSYVENPENADVVLFNSHHRIVELIKLKIKYPKLVLIHRIDGPVFLIRNDNIILDKLIFKLNHKLADASIFQTMWSKRQNINLGFKQSKFEEIIINAPDPKIFNKLNKLDFSLNRKTKIIATSWASNKIKGFETYKYLDETLDFTKFEMTFCGNTDYKFNNIKHIRPLPSNQLAKELKKHDIFITASKNDPCSNALIEAMHCGLPAIGYNSGGHPEIIGEGGLIFNDVKEIVARINYIVQDYNNFKSKIVLPQMSEVGSEYYKFIKKVYKTKLMNKNIKKLNILEFVSLYKSVLFHKIAKHF